MPSLSKALPATAPIGEPLHALVWPKGESDAFLGRWVRTVGRVHGARRRKGVAARFDALGGWDEGAYEFDARTGDPILLRVPSGTSVPECAFTHELGHYLDQQHLGDGVVPASEVDPVVRAVVQAAR